MAFVNEKNIKEYDENGTPIRVYDRTIDHERNIVLKHGGDGQGSGNRGRPDPGQQCFILQGDDFQVRIEAYQTYKEIEANKYDLFWEINRCWDVENVEGREDEIRDLIVEAMTMYGVRFGKESVSSITIEFGEYCSSIAKKNEIAPIVTLERDF